MPVALLKCLVISQNSSIVESIHLVASRSFPLRVCSKEPRISTGNPYMRIHFERGFRDLERSLSCNAASQIRISGLFKDAMTKECFDHLRVPKALRAASDQSVSVMNCRAALYSREREPRGGAQCRAPPAVGTKPSRYVYISNSFYHSLFAPLRNPQSPTWLN